MQTAGLTTKAQFRPCPKRPPSHASIILSIVRRSNLITPDRLVLLGAVLAAAAYIQDIRYDLILDDIPLILMNETITSWRNWKVLFVSDAFAGYNGSYFGPATVHYRPIYRLWQMLNEQMFGSVTPWWHITSLLLHIIVIFLVYLVGIKLVKERWTAALAAVLFAVHPIHAESVAYITASTDVLVALFMLAAFLAYFHYREQDGGSLYYVAAICGAALAMLSKETAAMFPWMLVAYEAMRDLPAGARRGWKQFSYTLPFFVVVGAYLVVRTRLFGVSTGAGPGANRWASLLDIPLVLLVYLRNLFVPFPLSFFYPVEWSSQWTVLKIIIGLVVIAAAWVLWKWSRDRVGVRLQIAWAAIFFLPALLGVFAFVPEEWVHDRHMYLVSVPICLIAAALLTDQRWPRKATATASGAVIAVLLMDLAVQVPRFADNTSLYTSALKLAPRSFHLHAYYAAALAGYGRTEDSIREYKITTELEPQSAATHEWYGGALADAGRDDEATVEYQKALELSAAAAPFRAYILSRMADLELKQSNFQDAAVHLQAAVQISPESPDYHASLARALNHQGRAEEAKEQLRLEATLRQRAVPERRASSN